MEELIKYLQDNKIEFNPIDNDFISIAGKRYFLVIPDEEGTLFSEDFVLKVNQLKCDRYVYKFGGNWYYDDTDKYDKPELNDLKYLGVTISPLVTDNFLGVRGGYEILNGTRLYGDWVKKAKFLNVKCLGICEKNTLAGVLKFQLECQKSGIKSIIGATYTIFRVKEDFRYDIKVYVKDEQGWENILLINKEVLVLNKGYITEERFSELIEGLFIVIDPKCLEFGQLGKLNRLFKFDYYQLDTVNYLNEDRDKEYLLNLKKFVRSDYKPVGITDAFYLDREDSYIKKTLNTMSNSMEYESDNQYFKDTEDYCNELEILFNKDDESFYDILTEALKNSKFVSDNCCFTIKTGQRYLPKYKMTKAESEAFSTNEDLFWALIENGLSERIKDNYDVYIDRIEKEFKVIKKGDVVDYFLILWDIINWARNKGILVGQGRGCFLPGSKVKMEDRTFKNIEDIKIGDKVLNYFFDSSNVENVFKYDVKEEIVELDFDNGQKIKCTKDHKFLTKNRGWVKADKLTEFDNIITGDNKSNIKRELKRFCFDYEEYFKLIFGEFSYNDAINFIESGFGSKFKYHDKCKICNNEYFKCINGLSGNVYKANVCPKCCLKYSVNTKECKDKNSKAQKIAQNTERQRLNNSNSSKNFFSKKENRLQVSNSLRKRYREDPSFIKKIERGLKNSGIVKTKRFGLIEFSGLLELSYIIGCDEDVNINNFKRYDLSPVQYKLDGEDRYRNYFPDFIVNDKIIEIKREFYSLQEEIIKSIECKNRYSLMLFGNDNFDIIYAENIKYKIYKRKDVSKYNYEITFNNEINK